ncbi:FO synthase subunit 1 [Methanococcoides vulcani]|uniref:7,8-didemethyl-8-hydroxy-5-deazariboflavin synthase n=1 Tax=Methanococcoides vulcani TaxID=1353158 RepID=A0A1H9Y9Y4_9EURY|nr:7,8-didemethyl-8-hydroxy-5-deazariboflavin synthase CofG [Methanococcoides vulcani]SES65657.1 FO synthase subunit 1 [Methanococcoides vulcani]
MPEFVTFSRNVFIPVTNICRNRCGYCTFRRDPDHPEARLMSVEEIIPILKNGKEAGCTEALFVFGEYTEEVPEYREKLKKMGYSSTIEYVTELCELAIEIGLLPHTNAGILNRRELEMLKPLNVSMGLMLETTAELKAHCESPGKAPSKRIEMIRTAGELRIPFTTGILVGIGESIEDRKHSLETIASIHKEFGHIQEVIIQNFMPKPDTPMADHAPPTKEEMIQTVSLAREILPDDVAVQVAPNLIKPHILIQYGATDLGGISPTTIDWINPEAEWPSVVDLQQMTGEIPLKERLPIYPQHIKEGWYSSNLSKLIETLTDKNGFKRKQQ